MIILILSVLDILSGLAILFKVNFFIRYLAFAMLAKGGISLFSSVAMKYFFDWMGAIDFIIGIILLLNSMNIYSDFFTIFSWIIIFKGVYSLIRYLLKI